MLTFYAMCALHFWGHSPSVQLWFWLLLSLCVSLRLWCLARLHYLPSSRSSFCKIQSLHFLLFSCSASDPFSNALPRPHSVWKSTKIQFSLPKILAINFRAKMVRMPLQIVSHFFAWTFKWRSILNETFLVVFVHCADLFFTTNRNRNRAKRRW